MLFNCFLLAAGLVVGYLMATIISARKNKRDLLYCGVELRYALANWAFSYKADSPIQKTKPDPNTPSGRLLAAIYNIGTNNIERTDRW